MAEKNIEKKLKKIIEIGEELIFKENQTLHDLNGENYFSNQYVGNGFKAQYKSEDGRVYKISIEEVRE